MKKRLIAAICAFCAIIITTSVGSAYAAEPDNLAQNKWSWETVGTGGAAAGFSDRGIKIEDFCVGSTSYVMYTANRLDEFKLSMYAKLNLNRPSDKGFSDAVFDCSTMFISFLVSTDNPIASQLCPWDGNKAYMSLSFENLEGNNSIALYMNECWNNSGATRYAVASTSFNYTDGNYHQFDMSVDNTTNNSGKTGKLFVLKIDGNSVLEYFMKDGLRSTASKDAEDMDVNFTDLTGYFGFWTTSYFPAGSKSSDTDCYVDIQKINLYNLSDDSAYGTVAAPEFDITTVNFSPDASYFTDEEIEIKLSKLFAYEGENEISYIITDGKEAPIGTTRNGYWVWTPDKEGTYDIHVLATVEGKTADNYFTLRVKAAETDSQPASESKASSNGCRSSADSATGGILLSALCMAGLLIIKKRGEKC